MFHVDIGRGQTCGWISLKLGMMIDIDPGGGGGGDFQGFHRIPLWVGGKGKKAGSKMAAT